MSDVPHGPPQEEQEGSPSIARFFTGVPTVDPFSPLTSRSSSSTTTTSTTSSSTRKRRATDAPQGATPTTAKKRKNLKSTGKRKQKRSKRESLKETIEKARKELATSDAKRFERFTKKRSGATGGAVVASAEDLPEDVQVYLPSMIIQLGPQAGEKMFVKVEEKDVPVGGGKVKICDVYKCGICFHTVTLRGAPAQDLAMHCARKKHMAAVERHVALTAEIAATPYLLAERAAAAAKAKHVKEVVSSRSLSRSEAQLSTLAPTTPATIRPRALRPDEDAVLANSGSDAARFSHQTYITGVLIDSGIKPHALDNEEFCRLLEGRSPYGTQTVSYNRTVYAETTQSVLATEEARVRLEMREMGSDVKGLYNEMAWASQRKRPYDPTEMAVQVRSGHLPVALITDASDLFKDGVTAVAARFVSKTSFEILTRVVDFHVHGGSQDAAEIQSMINGSLSHMRIQRRSVAVVVGDGCNTQVRAMVEIGRGTGGGTSGSETRSRAGGSSGRASSGTQSEARETAPSFVETVRSAASEGGGRDTDPVVSVCFAHLLNNAGKLLLSEKSFPGLDKFLRAWGTLMSKSSVMRAAWEDAIKAEAEADSRAKKRWTFKSSSRPGETRWFSRWEQAADLLDFWNILDTAFEDGGVLYSAAQRASDSKSVESVRGLLSDARGRLRLFRNLSLFHAFGKPLVAATYDLEAQSFIQPIVSTLLVRLRTFAHRMLSSTTHQTVDDASDLLNYWTDRFFKEQQRMLSGGKLGEALYQNPTAYKVDAVTRALPCIVYFTRALGMLEVGEKVQVRKQIGARHGSGGRSVQVDMQEVKLVDWPGCPEGEIRVFIRQDRFPRDSNKLRTKLYADSAKMFARMRFLDPRVALEKAEEDPGGVGDWMVSAVQELLRSLPENALALDGSSIIDNVRKESALYVDCARRAVEQRLPNVEDVTTTMYGECLWEFWRVLHLRGCCKYLVELVCAIALFVPTSADAERVFSRMGALFGKRQASTKDRNKKTRIIRYQNKKERRKESRARARRGRRGASDVDIVNSGEVVFRFPHLRDDLEAAQEEDPLENLTLSSSDSDNDR